MKNKAKRIVSAVCALAMCAAMLPAAAFAEGDVTSDGSNSISTQAVSGWLDSVTTTVGGSVTVHGGANWSGLTHDWDVLRGNDVVTITSGEHTPDVTVQANAEGVAVLRHTYWDTFWGIPYKSYEYVRINVTPSDPTVPDPEPTEGKEIYFYVALPTNTTLVDDVTPYRYLTCGGEVDAEAPQDTTLWGDEALTYVNAFPESGSLPGDIPEFINAPTSEAVGEGSSWTISDTGEVTVFDFVINDEHYTSEEYNFSWEKFSYAYTTDVVENAYHLDGMLYKKITLKDVLEKVDPKKNISDYVLDENGDLDYTQTFSFTLTKQDDESFAAVGMQAVTDDETDAEVAITLSQQTDESMELQPGTYVISEIQDEIDKLAWNDVQSDTITFNVNRDGSVVITDNAITNTPATYTVTYDDGVTEETITVPTDSNNYKYNAIVTVDDTAPTREGYTFAGWDADEDGEADYQPEGTFNISGNTILVALWTEQSTDPEEPTEPSVTPGEDSVELNKTATDVVNDQSDVTLTIGAQQETVGADVVFVLDKSTSTEVKTEALAMLDELRTHAKETGLQIKVGVITFNRTANNGEFNLALTELNDESYQQISAIFNKTLESGTNLEAGLRAGMAMLAADDTVFDSNKHLVLVSDGVTYMWGTSETPQTVYVELNNTKAASVDLVNDYYAYRSKDYEAYKNAANWMAAAKANGIEDVIAQYGTDYTVGDGNVETYIPAEEKILYSSLECAIYMAGKAWQEAADSGYQLYAFVPDDYVDQYPWAPNFICGLSTIGGSTTLYNDTANGVDGMFDAVENSVIYAIEKGIVTDVIGDDFDVASLDSFVLTVGGVEVPGTVNGNTISFGNNYTVTYYPNGTSTDAREQFVWAINTPVEKRQPCPIDLHRQAGQQGDHPRRLHVPTNEEATLDYTSTTGGSGTETFRCLRLTTIFLQRLSPFPAPPPPMSTPTLPRALPTAPGAAPPPRRPPRRPLPSPRPATTCRWAC